MLALFYQMKTSKSKSNFDINEYYSNLEDNSYCTYTKDINLSFKCRICLQEGSIPIFDDENIEIHESLQLFAEILITEEDDFPKHLCKICFKFISAAILFRKIAKRSDVYLRQPVKEESLFDMQDSIHNFDDCDTQPPDWSNEDTVNSIKIEKKEKNKFVPKVTCHVCNKVINRSYYKEHLTMHDPDHKKYVCDVCGKSFRLRCAYHNHSLRHRNDFPYKCQFCPYRGRYAELLKTHMRTHTGDYRYMCTECPARFLFKSNLNSHMLKHKEPQFKCEACKRAFHSKLMMQRHFEADHLGIKNHVCNMCGKAFGYRNAMMKHQRHVHKREKLLFGRMPSYLEVESEKQMSC